MSKSSLVYFRYLMKGSVLYIKHSRKDDMGVYHCLVAAKNGKIIETLTPQLGALLTVSAYPLQICTCPKISMSRHFVAIALTMIKFSKILVWIGLHILIK